MFVVVEVITDKQIQNYNLLVVKIYSINSVMFVVVSALLHFVNSAK